MQHTLEQYLRDAASAGAIDHAVRASVDAQGVVSIVIHPAGRDGETRDFVVTGDSLSSAARIGAANVS